MPTPRSIRAGNIDVRGDTVFGHDVAVDELRRITDWWLRVAPDDRHGGFFGEIDPAGRAVPAANKGIILNSRILWFFSKVAQFSGGEQQRRAAHRAFLYLREHFHDEKYGGVFWEVSCDGRVVNDRKQTYALCFCIYALCAYHELTSAPAALAMATGYFDLLQERVRDRDRGGYFEAFARDWTAIDDVRLGADDMNAPKTMNTHLHLLEALAALHRIAAPGSITESLREALRTLCERIFDSGSGHLQLYFDRAWNSLSPAVSFGHDIEASWLLWDAAQLLRDPAALGELRPVVDRLAGNCLRKGLRDDGGVRDDSGTVWWVQAEALVGFLTAWRLSGDSTYREAADRVWHFIATQHIDTDGGEWRWHAARDDAGPMYKAGFWKGPYHNGRAMLESIRLLDSR
jgi:cellobiose epimerase